MNLGTDPKPRIIARWLLVGLAVMWTNGCIERIPADRYGVQRLRFEGVESFSDKALRACLATAERDRLTANFLVPEASDECGEPPFDWLNISLPLWQWWFTEWPLYDRSVFERDLQRIERWYRARGFYEAEVRSASFEPAAARVADRVGETECDHSDGEGCEVEITVQIDEGEPVVVRERKLEGGDRLPPDLVQEIAGQWQLEVGDRFDEALYDATKSGMQHVLREVGYGCAEVEGEVSVNVDAHEASVVLDVKPGPQSVIGRVTILGNGDLSETVIRSVGTLESGDQFRESDLRDAQHNIYGLGAFASVEVVGKPQMDGHECNGVVDVEIVVTPGRRFRYGLGAGAELGAAVATGVNQSVPQNNIHLLGFLEHRNFFGGLRRARVDLRPKLLFNVQDFRESLSFGGDVRFELRQPAFIESRTTAVLELRNDFAPDPFETPADAPLRNMFDLVASVRRSFLSDRLRVRIGAHLNLYRVVGGSRMRDATGVDIENRDYRVFFFEQRIAIDLRDRSPQPSRPGMWIELELQEAVAGSWQYIRVVPDFRVYVPLGPLTLAGRFRLGSMHILSSTSPEDSSLDDNSRRFGPNPFRLRAGGANSHRGFLAGFLGDTHAWNVGGLRRWEASLELRVPITELIGVAAFADVGDVNRESKFRFNRIRLGVGGGFRLRTPLGTIRLDIGVLIPGAQDLDRLGETVDERQISLHQTLRFIQRTDATGASIRGFPGAFHVSIGEAF